MNISKDGKTLYFSNEEIDHDTNGEKKVFVTKRINGKESHVKASKNNPKHLKQEEESPFDFNHEIVIGVNVKEDKQEKDEPKRKNKSKKTTKKQPKKYPKNQKQQPNKKRKQKKSRKKILAIISSILLIAIVIIFALDPQTTQESKLSPTPK